MTDKTFLNSHYIKTCSCCGDNIHKSQFENNEIPEDNKEPEGNHCGRCYGELQLRNWFEVKRMRDMVADAFKNPINRFKFTNEDPEIQYYYCMKMMDKGIISWKIG